MIKIQMSIIMAIPILIQLLPNKKIQLNQKKNQMIKVNVESRKNKIYKINYYKLIKNT